MAYTTTLGELLAQRAAAQQPQVPPALAQLSGLGPILAAPRPTTPQLGLADLLAGAQGSMTKVMPATAQPTPAMSMDNAAGAAQPTEAGAGLGEALAPLMQLFQGFTGSDPGQQATPRPADLATAVGSAAAQDRRATPETPSPYALPEGMGGALDWIKGLLGGSEAPAGAATPAQAHPTASVAAAVPVAPAQPAPPVAAPAQTTTGAQTQQQASAASKTSQPAQVGDAVSAAVSKAIPDLPEADAKAIKTVFQQDDLFKMMVAMGSALDSGKSYGESVAIGTHAYLGAQQARKVEAAAKAKQAFDAAQQTFENKLEVAKLQKGMDKDAAEADLARARAEAAKAGIAVTQEQVNLVRAQTQKNLAQAAKAGRDEKAGLTPKDYAKLMLDVQNDMELNGTVPDDATTTDESRVRVNLALPEELRQYAPVPSSVKEEVKAIAEKPALTPEDKTRLERYRLLYGSVI